MIPLKFPVEAMKYVIPDKNGYTATSGAKIREDAPQWAKDEYEEFIRELEKARGEDLEA